MCHSVAGGQVYPQETCGPQEGQRSIGHTIQWSQAISKRWPIFAQYNCKHKLLQKAVAIRPVPDE